MWTFSGEFIIGRVIKALNNSWHPECFCCDICRTVLAEVGFVKNAGRWTRLTAALIQIYQTIVEDLTFSFQVIYRFCIFDRHLCRKCHNGEKGHGLGKYICQKCHCIIEEVPLIYKNDPYHPDHFNCNNCGWVLNISLKYRNLSTTLNIYFHTFTLSHRDIKLDPISND